MLKKPEWYLLDLLHVSILYFVIAQWLKDPGPRSEKRTLLCDMACFLLITPLAAISGWLCLRGAQDHLQLKSRLEAVGLIALTIALFTIYILWTLVTKPPRILQRHLEVLAASQCCSRSRPLDIRDGVGVLRDFRRQMRFETSDS